MTNFKHGLIAVATLALGLTVNASQAQVIDTFDQTVQTRADASGFNNAGYYRYLSYSGAGPIGGERLAAVLDAHSGHLGGSVHALIDPTNSGSIAFWGSTAPDAGLYYGTAIDAFIAGLQPWERPPTTPYPPFTSGPDLGLSASLMDTFQIDVVSNLLNDNATVFLFDNTGAQAYFSFGALATGTNSVALSGFTNIGGLNLSDIAGVRIALGLNSSQIQSNAVVLDEIRLVAAPVPEPETYAMMLAGLGLLGFMRRRKQRAA